MSWDLCEETEPVAKKDYPCEASLYIIHNDLIREQERYGQGLTPEEKAAIDKARAEGFQILKGTKYRKVKGRFDNEFSTFRARIEIDDICHKYDFYDN